MNKEFIKDKKPVQMKLSSMSEHWDIRGKKSGKNRSQDMQALKRRQNRKRKRISEETKNKTP